MKEEENNAPNYLEVIAKLINVIVILLIVIVIMAVLLYTGFPKSRPANNQPDKPAKTTDPKKAESNYWIAPDTGLLQGEKNAEIIRYGRNLVANTSFYFGPGGKLQHSSNGMNCQNCHLDAGTKLFGNNYAAVASTYPKFRERSGSIETIAKRVNDCFERSLNGSAIDTAGNEMQAIIAYIKWLGKDVEKNARPEGAGLKELAYMERAADPARGKELYALKCKSCHEEDGRGKMEDEKMENEKWKREGNIYKYPPLWGDHSYNNGAGLYRLSRFASYIKYNMPQGATFENPQLSDEEAWDIAAFVNSQPRPVRDLSKDWPNMAGKPVDHPFGPYTDKFSEQQHKYGPFEPIASAKKVKKNK